MLLYLKDFSQKMISRVHEIEKEVDGLMHDSKVIKCCYRDKKEVLYKVKIQHMYWSIVMHFYIYLSTETFILHYILGHIGILFYFNYFIFQMTGVRVNNVFNDFIMLANTQFVENVSIS